MTDQQIEERRRHFGTSYAGANELLEIILDDNPDLFTDRGYRVLDDLRVSLDSPPLADDVETPRYGPGDGMRERLRAFLSKHPADPDA